jgi:uncharacterized protein (TIGR02246 family)
MMRVALVLALLATGCPAKGPEAPTAPATSAEVTAAAKATVEQWRQGYEVRSFDALAKLYAHDGDVVSITEGVPLVGWTAIEASLRDRLAHATAIRVRLKDVRIATIAPTVATVVAGMTRELTDGATTTTEQGTLTLTLRKEGDGWMITLEHYSYRRPS